MRLTMVVLILTALLPERALAMQSLTVTGVVTDTGGKAVRGAQIIGPSGQSMTTTGRDGRFRLALRGASTCTFSVLSESGTARISLETCPDTILNIIVKRTRRTDTINRCGTRIADPCTDRDGLRFTTMSAGQVHSCGITTDSIAYCWGDGRSGQLGHGEREVSRYPQRVDGNLRFVEIGAGGAYSCGRTAAGQVYCWGNERTVPGWPHQPEGPVLVRSSEPATALTVGGRHACVLDGSGRASCWGWNVDGETGIGVGSIEQSIVPRPTHVMTDSRFTMLSAGFGFTCGVTTEARVLCWGSNVDRVLGANAPERCGDVGAVPCSTRPVAIEIPERIAQVSSGAGHACALSEREEIYCWGANSAGQAGVYRAGARWVTTPTIVTLPVQGRVMSVSSGGIHTCALTSTQLAYCWGSDNTTYGREITDADQVGPRVAGGGRRFRAISTGQVFTCALDTGNRLQCWGDTILGALGVR